jgi:hypothetical protein
LRDPDYRIVLASNLQGADPVDEPIDGRILSGPPARVQIDLNDVRFARPSGLGYLYVLIYTLRKRGHQISLTQPAHEDSRNYIRRTNFWSLLAQYGFTVPGDWHGYNLGKAPGLIECSLLTTHANLTENMQSSLLSYDRMRKALARPA